MNAKSIAVCSIFVAIAVVLGRFAVPIPILPFYFWEIPIVVALLLYGFKMGFSVAAISIFIQAIIYPKAIGIFFPIWNLIAMSTTLVAIALIQWYITRKATDGLQTKKQRVNRVMLYLGATLGLRLAIMPFVNYVMYKYMLPLAIGKVYTDVYLIALIPTWLIFDAILVLYTVPTSYMIAKRVSNDLKMGNTLF
ncbi:MAG: ECF transporter S component [Candidatus Bathyarchaeia archaeon]|jgi:riboflavin transporter FmnP